MTAESFFATEIETYISWCVANRTSPRVSELASKLGRSRSAIAARFSKRSSGTLGAALRAAQIGIVKKLLLECDLPLSKVATLAGFGSERAFYRAFRRMTGETPGQYRRSTTT